MRIRTPFSLLAFGLFLASPTAADVIHKTDGRDLEDVTIIEENISQVVYKKGSDSRVIRSERVLSVEFEKLPRLLDEATALIAEDDLPGALYQFDQYVEGQIANPGKERRKWAPAWAAWRTVEFRWELADVAGVVKAADRLIKRFPDSRYLPSAYLIKAGAQDLLEKTSAAQRTLADLRALIDSAGLSKRWDLECRLAIIQVDSTMKGGDRRARLVIIEDEANEFPTVQNRVRLAEGETYLDEAVASVSDQVAAQKLRDEARRIFEEIIADFNAEPETLAGAYTGLGDSLYLSGATSKDVVLLNKAVLQYLRVVTVYEAQSRYVPRAYLSASKCFKILEDRSRERDMVRSLKRLYPGSRWAEQAG